MAITDIQFSEELQTGAPSIKYRGNEGPKAPTQMAAGEDPLLVEEYEKYVFDMQEQGLQPMSFEEFKRQAIAGYAYGGIAGTDGRRRYGIGSKLKRTVRKLIPNEVADVAVKAAPFVAPFNAPLAAAMSGLGTFDRTGSIGSSLKRGLGTYAQGRIMSGIGGGGYQSGKTLNPFSGDFYTQFTSPIGTESGIGKWWDQKGQNLFKGAELPTSKVDSPTIYESIDDSYTTGKEFDLAKSGSTVAKENLTLGQHIKDKGLIKGVLANIDEAKLSTKAMMGILGVSGAAGLYTAMTQPQEELETLDRGVGLPGGISGIRTEVIEAMKDPSGEKLKALRIKYPFLGARETKNLDLMAQGGRAGYYAGGQSIPSEYTIEDARKSAMQDKLGGISEVMKQADLYRQGDVGQMYMAEGGIMMASAPTLEDSRNEMSLMLFGKPLHELTDEELEILNESSKRKPKSRVMAQEGGLMDLGGMEKDYRETGGFVDIGAKEKADDVPARLSVNEFVMTADAVRGAGDGNIDVGAERMEDLMEKLEAKNKRQQGASDMFEVSERLSEVV